MTANKGFSLIELLVTISIVAILGGVVAPGFTEFIRDNRQTSQLNTLIGSIHLSRGEAASRRQLITLCASSNASSCNTTHWENGWIIFTDSNNSGNGIIDGADELILVQEAFDGNGTLRAPTLDSSGKSLLQFRSDGFLFSSTTPSQGTFVLCDSEGVAEAKAVIVNISGVSRLAIDQDDPLDGIVNDHQATPANVTCP